MTNEQPDMPPVPGSIQGRPRGESGMADALIVYLIAVLYVVGFGFLLRMAANRWLNLLFPVGIGAIPVLFARLRGIRFSRAFPLSVPSRGQTVGACLLSAGALAGFLLVSLVLSVFFPDLGDGAAAGRLLKGGFAYNLFFIGVLPALSEELLCRGLILSCLRSSLARWPAIIACSLMFACLHMEPLSVPFTFAAGLAIGWVAVETASLFLPVLMHLLHNLSLYLVIMKSGEGSSLPGVGFLTDSPVPAGLGSLVPGIALLALAGAMSAIMIAAGIRLIRGTRS